MKTVAVLLVPGFEEGEAVVTIDVLRRLNIGVETLSCTDIRTVISYGITAAVVIYLIYYNWQSRRTEYVAPVTYAKEKP